MRRHRFGCTGGVVNSTYPNMGNTTAQNTCGTNTMTGVNNGMVSGMNPMYGTNGTTTYQELAPIMTCSKNVVNNYHIVKQPYVHTYHTEVVHHHIKQAEYIPNYTCSEVHVNETPTCGR